MNTPKEIIEDFLSYYDYLVTIQTDTVTLVILRENRRMLQQIAEKYIEKREKVNYPAPIFPKGKRKEK